VSSASTQVRLQGIDGWNSLHNIWIARLPNSLMGGLGLDQQIPDLKLPATYPELMEPGLSRQHTEGSCHLGYIEAQQM